MDALTVALVGQVAMAEMVRSDERAEQRPARHYIVQSAAAPMPSSCKGKYKRVAVLLVDADREFVSMISIRAIGCHEIVHTWEKRNVGKTERGAYQRALKEAQEMADDLNHR